MKIIYHQFTFYSEMTQIHSKNLIISVLICIFAFNANSQEQRHRNQSDSSANLLRSYGLELSLSRPVLQSSTSQNLNEIVFPALLQRSIAVPMPTLSLQLQANLQLQSIWKDELARQNEYRTLRYVLQSVQIGADAYLTYLYLKRYGLK